MGYGNACYNELFWNSDKEYSFQKDNININDTNNVHSIIVNEIAPNSLVLDVGCSYGYIGEWLVANKGCAVYGIDNNKKVTKKLKSKKVYQEVICFDLDRLSEKHLPFNELNGFFDYIICADVLEHLKDPSNAIINLLKLLKPNGSFIVSVPNIANGDIVLNLLCQRFNYSRYGLLDNTHLRFFTKESFHQWIGSINSSGKLPNPLVCNTLASTFYSSETVEMVKNKFPRMFDLLYGKRDEPYIFQYVFIVKRNFEAKSPEETEDIDANYYFNSNYTTIESFLIGQAEVISKQCGQIERLEKELTETKNQLADCKNQLNDWLNSRIGKYALKYRRLKNKLKRSKPKKSKFVIPVPRGM